MEESNTKKLYSQQGISIATFFGGPLAAGYLIRQNFRALGKEREGLISIILGILFTVAVFIPLFTLPEGIIDKIPNQLIPVIYTLIIYGIVELVQGKELKRHKEDKKQFESNWKASGIGFLWMLVLIGVLLAYIFPSPEISSELDQEITQKMEKISTNEDKALKLYSLDPNHVTKEELLMAVKEEGIFYWEENIQLLEGILEIELEESYRAYVKKLLAYMQVRKETYTLILKSIEEETDKYNAQIAEKSKAIEILLKELN